MSVKRPSIADVREDSSNAGLMLCYVEMLWRAYTRPSNAEWHVEWHGEERDWDYVWSYVSRALEQYDSGIVKSRWWFGAVGINVWHLHSTIRHYMSCEGGLYWNLDGGQKENVLKAYAEARASLIGYVSAMDYVLGEGY